MFPIAVDDGALAAMAEPVSIAVRAVRRGRIEPGERVVVLGAGPIGQCVAIVAPRARRRVLMVDLQESRLELARANGAETLRWHDAEQVVAYARGWGGAGGPPVVVDATGVPRRRCGPWSTWSRRRDGRSRWGCRSTRSRCGSAA